MKTRITFHKLEIENFMSIGPKVIFNYDSHSGLNFVSGINRDIDHSRNGVGKSLIFISALYFAIFGRTQTHCKNAYIPNRIFSNQKIDTSVLLEFSIGQDDYSILSVIKYNLKTVVNTTLYKNGINITKPGNVETRKFIQQEIFKCSANMFKNSVIITPSEISNFLMMKKQQKREYIEETFGLSIFGKILKTVRSDYNNLDKEVQIVEREVKTLTDQMIKLNEQVNQFDSIKKQKIQSILLKIKEKLIEYKSIKDINNEFQISNAKEKLEQIKKMLNDLENTYTKIISSKKSCLNSINHINKKIESVNKITNKVCQSCKDKIEQEYNFNTDINLLEEENKKSSQYDLMALKIKNKITELNEQLNPLKNIVIEEENKIKEINDNQWKIKILEKEIKDLQTKRKEEEEQQPPFNNIIEHTQLNSQSARNRLNDMYKNKQLMDIILTAVGEDGAKKYIIKDLVQLMNSLVQKYIQEMGGEYTCIFDENFEVTFLTTTGECEYNNFSMGEKQRINLAIMLAFQDIQSTNIETNIVIFDEVLDQGIDTYGFKAVMNILKRRTVEKNQIIFVISHREAAIDECTFDNIITIEKKNNITSIISDFQQKGE